MNRISLPLYAAKDIHTSAMGIVDMLVGELQHIDTDQLTLDLGTDQALEEAMVERDVHLQAIEDFMVERETFKARNAFLVDCVDSQTRTIKALMRSAADGRHEAIDMLGAENAKLRTDVKALEAVTLQAAAFMDTLRDRLAYIGVTFEADASGMPQLTIDAMELANALYGQMKAHQAQAA